MTEENSNNGRQIGNYRALAEIGSGGFGRVYQGEHIFLTERSVAIKFLHTHLSSLEERERFLQEARFLEKLKHPHMLHVFDVGIDNGFPYLVTEYAPNGSLRNLLKRYAPSPLPPEEVLHILSQIGQALYYAHQQQIIHRDLKPENILFNAQGEALLTDFGIATTLSTASVKAVTLIGTPPYMAPEQFQGMVSKESDQYSLGCIAYELVTGQTPFTASDFFAMGFKHMSAIPVPPGQLNPQLPIHVEQAILKALAKQRSDRHPDIRAFISALRMPAPLQVETPTILKRPLTAQSQSSATLFTENPTLALTSGSSATNSQNRSQLPYESDRDNTLAASNPGWQTPRQLEFATPLPPMMQTSSAGQAPVTPLPEVFQTPSGEQGPITPFLPIASTMPFSRDNHPTMISSPGIPEVINLPAPEMTGQVNRFNTGDYQRTTSGGGLIGAPPVKTSNRRRFSSKRALFIFAATCILLVASIISVLVFASNSPTSRQSIIMQTPTSAFTATSISTQPTGKPTSKSTQAAGSNHNGLPTTTATHGSGPHSSPTSTLGPTAISTSDPTAIPTSDPTAGPSPDPTPVSDTLTVSFKSNGVTTVHSYSGPVTIQVSGIGQASSTRYSDAFYIFTDASGNPASPIHASCWVLNIDGQPTDNFVSKPPYNSSNSYTFQITAPGGPLTFNVCDGDHSDNTGQYYIAVTQN